MSSGDVLYLAVRDVYVDDKRLEGIGVQPDVVIERPFLFEANDPQIEKALKDLMLKLEDR